MVNDVILTRLYRHTPNSSHIAVPHLTTRHFSRHFQTIHINAAPDYTAPLPHPQPRVTVHLHHFLSTHIPIPHIREAMHPLPIPTYGKPTILPSYMLLHTNHPAFSTMSFTTIRHFYLPKCTRAPSYTQYIPRGRTLPYPNFGETVQS